LDVPPETLARLAESGVALLRVPVRSPRAYRVGMVLTLRAGDKAQRATIHALKRQRLADVTAADARAEGARFPAEIRDRFPGVEETWVLLLVAGDRRDRPRLLRAGAPKPQYCRCGRGFPADASHCPACGRPRPLEREDDRGYTSRTSAALRGEPEAVDDATLERFASEARERDANRQRERLARLESELASLRAELIGDRAYRHRVRALEHHFRQLRAQLLRGA
jgi:hypothetical protein